MSISAMVASAVLRQEELTTPVAEIASGLARTKDSPMEKVTRFVPSEVIGLYVAGMAIFSTEGAQAKWLIYFICLGTIPLLVLIGNTQQKKKLKLNKTPNPKLTLLVIVFALVAFTAWAWALPETPFLACTPLAVKIGGVAVMFLAATMYPLADRIGILPKR